MSPSRGLIFDLDDTLYPHVRFVRSGLAAVARHVQQRFGIPAGIALKTMAGASAAPPRQEFQRLCQRFGLGETTLPELLTVFRTHAPSLWLFHDAEQVLVRLRAEGWRLAILTNGVPEIQSRKVHALGLGPLVDHVVYAAEHAEGGKPHAAPFQAALRRLELPAAHCVMVGDDPVCDVQGARAVGMRAIGVVRESPPRVREADAIVTELAQVPDVAVSLISTVTAHAA